MLMVPDDCRTGLKSVQVLAVGWQKRYLSICPSEQKRLSEKFCKTENLR